MARMIPEGGPREFDALSGEGALYESLSSLPDDFWVVHSYALVSTRDSAFDEAEADFLVFHKDLGVLCIEAKAGQASYSKGEWRYASGMPMKKGGPYRQSALMKYRVMDRFSEVGLGDALHSCKCMHAVWFPSLSREQLEAIDFPPEASIDLTLCADDLLDPEPRIRAILSIDVAYVETRLSDAVARAIVRKVLCPEFSVVPTTRFKYELADISFARLLDSQARVLNFLEEQRTAVINGAAGTGKTLIAVERARRAAARGEKVLFLCFNSLLRSDVAARCADEPNIKAMTAAGFACWLCDSPVPDYEALALRILGLIEAGKFPYLHVIVDEGQDFGSAEIDAAGILGLLHDAVRAQEGGTFYLFYDRRQLVQASSMPAFIEGADCKLTLYVNCRNSEDIAACSMGALQDAREVEVKGAPPAGGPPQAFFSESVRECERYVDEQIAALQARGLADIAVLTCKTEQATAFSSCVRGRGPKKHWKQTGAAFHTCRKFKGLEADAVVLVDVDETLWRAPQHAYDPHPGLMFYTGASRAKHELRIACSMGEAGCVEVLKALGIEGERKPFARLAKRLSAVVAQA